VMSHLPTPSDPPHFFASFPWDNPGDPRDVGACLADTSVPADPPPPTVEQPVPTEPGELCYYGPSTPCFSNYTCVETGLHCRTWNGWQLPSNACSPAVKAQWLSQFSGTLGYCMRDMLEFLCSGTHLQQVWGQEGNVVSHVYDHTTEAGAVQDLLNRCQMQLISDGNPQNAQEAQCLAERWGPIFKLHACKADGTLDGKAP
jgi:hypothetical protein